MALDTWPILNALAIGLAAGIAILAALSIIPRTAAIARSLWVTLLTEVVILAGAAVPFLVGGLWLKAFLVLLSARVGYECAAVTVKRLPSVPVGRAGHIPLAVAGISAALSVAAMVVPVGYSVAFASAFVLLAGVLLVSRPRSRHAPVVEALIFPGSLLFAFVSVASDAALAPVLLLAFLLVETYDSYALLGGKVWGRSKAFPNLSPNKTIEGLAFGAGALALTTVIAGYLLLGMPPLKALMVAAVVAVFSVAGDLAASRLKRAAGVKDYPAVLPRQGGLFDIVDAWLMTGPALAVLALLGGF
ncbi:phosphatidate cytidylyltransferase [Stappia sp. F7233]|uniref:Phosphatidate cytidylyltransferase n=1 Tax=Stappia albiluteola TaxID=2758565 RepID=A0A839AFV6_9HYPH|nr:phosphatidate cytidylyltransferase [Stappia albiluteola]MBA5778740.1 phosphatidate cytidylyltransferase [Stappia albiluteola]